MLEMHPNLQSIKKHPAHKDLMYTKVLKSPVGKLPMFAVHNSSNVTSSLDFSSLKPSKNSSFHNASLKPIWSKSKSPE